MNPIEALGALIFNVMTHHRYKRPGVPGEVIEKSSTEYRDALKGLKSKDVENVMKEWLWLGHAVDRASIDRDYLRKMKLEFDRNLRL